MPEKFNPKQFELYGEKQEEEIVCGEAKAYDEENETKDKKDRLKKFETVGWGGD